MKEYYRYRDDEEVLAAIERIAQFDGFTRAELQSMLKLGRVVRYEPGEYIIRQGELDCWIYFLLSGLLDVLRDDRPIAFIRKRFELFGEISVIDAAPRSTSVRARKPSLVLGVDASLLDRSDLADHTVLRCTLYKSFSEILAERVRRLTEENSKLRATLGRYRAAKDAAGTSPAIKPPQGGPAIEAPTTPTSKEAADVGPSGPGEASQTSTASGTAGPVANTPDDESAADPA